MLSSSRFSNSDSMLGSLGSKFTCFLLGCRGTWLSFISILPWTWASSSLYNNKRDELGSYSQILWYEHIFSRDFIDGYSGSDIIKKQLLCPYIDKISRMLQLMLQDVADLCRSLSCCSCCVSCITCCCSTVALPEPLCSALIASWLWWSSSYNSGGQMMRIQQL